mgnify:CR=1 FL=1
MARKVKKMGRKWNKMVVYWLKRSKKRGEAGDRSTVSPLILDLRMQGDEIPHIFDPCGAPYFWLMGAPYIWPVVTFRPIFLTYKGSSPLWHKKISTKMA